MNKGLIAVILITLALLIGFASLPGRETNIAGLNEALAAIEADTDAVMVCIDSSEMADRVNKGFNDAQELGITGTPGSILINRESGLGVLIPGAFPLEILQSVKEALLNEETSAGSTVYELPENDLTLTATEFPNLDPVTDEDNIMGSGEAPIALIEYSDFDCPYCKVFHPIAYTFEENNEDVMWVYRHFPLRSIHPGAQKKSEAAECVRSLHGIEKFWEFTYVLYNQVEN